MRVYTISRPVVNVGAGLAAWTGNYRPDSRGPRWSFRSLVEQTRDRCWRSLKHHGLRKRRSLLLPLGFLFALLVGRALTCGDLVEGAPLRLQRTWE